MNLTASFEKKNSDDHKAGIILGGVSWGDLYQ
jgi:hypothetical protein